MRIIVAAAALAAVSCASAPPPVEAPPAQAALCSPGVSLGKVVIVPLTRWRDDQKEPQVREAIAMRAIEKVAPSISCAESAKVMPIALDAQVQARLVQARLDSANTAIVIHIEELGPIAVLSFPTLWSTWSDVKFTLEAVDVASGEASRTIPHHRREGGAYEARGLDPLQGEMEQALKDVIAGVGS